MRITPFPNCGRKWQLSCVFLFLQQAEVEQKKKRTFRKFTYRGVDLDQLLDMS
ncbi:hypothetical protein E2320_022251 [Naja naja]|nr:hypothetical protein E2320_022251 [Naja naja]